MSFVRFAEQALLLTLTHLSKTETVLRLLYPRSPRALIPVIHAPASRHRLFTLREAETRLLHGTMLHNSLSIWALVTALLGTTLAQTPACPTILTPSYSAPVVGSGWTAQIVANGLTKPRGLVFDANGALLVVQQGVGILRMTFVDNGGTCLVVNETKTLVEDDDVGSLRFSFQTGREAVADMFLPLIS